MSIMKHNPPPPFRRFSPQTVFLMSMLVLACVVFAAMFLVGGREANGRGDENVSKLRLQDIPFNGARAYEYLKQLCDLGPRPSGSPGMVAQQNLLTDHFRKLGAEVELQQFNYPHPQNGNPVAIGNLIVRWHPRTQDRILLCTHYDTLPFPLRDRQDPRGVFVGANDGGSGTALLMELGHSMAQFQSRYGVDFVFFDAEEFMFVENGRFFVGSEHFARRYVQERPPYRYRWAVLLDMVGDADLQLFQEINGLRWPETRPLVEDIWRTARRLGVREFIPRPKHQVSDDHLMLHDIAGIPACNIIDFDYPAWHTRADTPQQCSALSLAKVGWVLREWLNAQR